MNSQDQNFQWSIINDDLRKIVIEIACLDKEQIALDAIVYIDSARKQIEKIMKQKRK